MNKYLLINRSIRFHFAGFASLILAVVTYVSNAKDLFVVFAFGAAANLAIGTSLRIVANATELPTSSNQLN